MVAKKEIRLSQEEYLRLKKMESRYRSIESIVAEAPVVIIVTNREHHIIEFNPLAEKITGYSREEAVGKSIVELISTPENVELSHQILNKTFEGEGVKNFEASIRIADGNRVDMIWNNEVLRDEQGNPFALVSIGLDLTDQRKMEKKLHRLSNYDSLTGMDNVPFFRNKLDEQLKQLVKTAQQGFFYILDIDNFRHINEVEGHFVGDKLLVHVADKIQSELGDNDLCARISGDSFLLYLHKMPDRNPEDVVGKIIDNVKEVWTYMDMAYYVTLSVGGAAFPQDGTDFFTLMKHADIALTYAKETGKNKTSYFKKRIAKRAYDFIEMDRALFQALKYKQFTLCYQPKIDSTTHKPIGSEALIRWYSPSKGFISPNDFIPHAEMNGDILAIEQWVIERAVAFQRKLRNMGSTGQPVSINISGKSLINEETPLVLERILAKYQVSPCEVEIEITETAVIKDMEKAVKHLMKLKKIGVKVALDDFGTGYSSLTQLKDLPIDIVKLDQSFLTNICEDQESEKIFKAVVGLCHELGLQVVAEGVETIEQLSKAKEYECDIIQGYYFSMPLMQDAYVEYLKEEGFEGLNWGRK